MSNMLIRTLLLAVVSGYVFTPSSFACQCNAPGDTLSEAKTARAVFTGTVTSLSARGGDFVEVRVHVIERFKGAIENGSEIQIETASGGPACGFVFSTGRTYLIYAHSGYTSSNLGVSHCSRTATLEKSTEDLRVLRSLK
jgi:hypothetical protein